jgi:hypothetical protein
MKISNLLILENNKLPVQNASIIFLLLFGLWGYWHCGHSWPIVPASDDSEGDYGEADGM